MKVNIAPRTLRSISANFFRVSFSTGIRVQTNSSIQQQQSGVLSRDSYTPA
jgi:hypothetical protein